MRGITNATTSRTTSEGLSVISPRDKLDEGKNRPPKRPRLQDERELGEWKSIYPPLAKFEIYGELVYLLILLLAALFAVGSAGLGAQEAILSDRFYPFGRGPETLYWTATLGGGVAGGTIFALKWLYHSVAKKLWHSDRRVWRITAPVLSGVIALFMMMLIKSEILPVLNPSKIDTPLAGAAIAFVLGLFSDNILAALQNFAGRTFGTLRDKNQKDIPRHRQTTSVDHNPDERDGN